MYDRPNINNTEIISVNYNTPELIDKLLSSIREFYPENPSVRIIDGSDNKEAHDDIIKVINKYKNIKMDMFGYNIHHGPGMDYGIRSSKQPYLLIFDSDCHMIKAGYLEECFNLWKDELYAIGDISYVNKYGINPKENAKKRSNSHPYAYCHPNALFVKKEMYFKFHPYVKHGAPVISTMIDIHNKGLSNDILFDATNIQQKYLDRGGRGTVNKFGYNL